MKINFRKFQKDVLCIKGFLVQHKAELMVILDYFLIMNALHICLSITCQHISFSLKCLIRSWNMEVMPQELRNPSGINHFILKLQCFLTSGDHWLQSHKTILYYAFSFTDLTKVQSDAHCNISMDVGVTLKQETEPN